ncbi:MAG TPA: NADH-quinone oxidoreductase subunit NuoH [Candidatus Syntrophoarchaeum butanivorans]|uniref:F(420)H(2) dehydrogenase subunit H n=1 Tax=Candidatus Syntropharchaeum butanivorans TaxID=1839936 RepID=A0A1F2P6X3_9EURY|nr:MAG: F420H2:quinone oxidoreductase subunit H [Candidatus Syntrophoarchaeum butanivorans]RJS73361.1 MAG: NADH-quinone oxidoreductase subunit NuoH [Candidatus Syntrophoarchaeum sp. WYZ-LMO15]HEC57240.1 NADH-quinone oxidoreductase subunit NuoH [Candidatus Syntrophoarchaeum butanivorans]
MTGTVEALINLMMADQVAIPLLDPILNILYGIPLLGHLLALILWKPLFAALICPGFATLGGLLMLLPWIERKLVARIQWRIGPHEILPQMGGVIQLLADSLRFLFQEVIVHRDAKQPYFLQFPVLSFIPALLPLLFIPAGTIIAIESPYGAQIVLAMVTLFPLFILGLGWASNSRFAYIGTVREAFVYFGYEIALIVSAFAMIVLYGTSDPLAISGMQQVPGIILNPVAALAFFIASAMATSRLPFEIPEADQELAGGPHVEYSGILFGLIYVISYEKVYILSGLMTLLFLGGGSGPEIRVLGDLSGLIWFILKTLLVMIALIALRAIYPRYRLDQALRIGWNPVFTLSTIAVGVSLMEVLLL